MSVIIHTTGGGLTNRDPLSVNSLIYNDTNFTIPAGASLYIVHKEGQNVYVSLPEIYYNDTTIKQMNTTSCVITNIKKYDIRIYLYTRDIGVTMYDKNNKCIMYKPFIETNVDGYISNGDDILALRTDVENNLDLYKTAIFGEITPSRQQNKVGVLYPDWSKLGGVDDSDSKVLFFKNNITDNCIDFYIFDVITYTNTLMYKYEYDNLYTVGNVDVFVVDGNLFVYDAYNSIGSTPTVDGKNIIGSVYMVYYSDSTSSLTRTSVEQIYFELSSSQKNSFKTTSVFSITSENMDDYDGTSFRHINQYNLTTTPPSISSNWYKKDHKEIILISYNASSSSSVFLIVIIIDFENIDKSGITYEVLSTSNATVHPNDPYDILIDNDTIILNEVFQDDKLGAVILFDPILKKFDTLITQTEGYNTSNSPSNAIEIWYNKKRRAGTSQKIMDSLTKKTTISCYRHDVNSIGYNENMALAYSVRKEIINIGPNRYLIFKRLPKYRDVSNPTYIWDSFLVNSLKETYTTTSFTSLNTSSIACYISTVTDTYISYPMIIPFKYNINGTTKVFLLTYGCNLSSYPNTATFNLVTYTGSGSTVTHTGLQWLPMQLDLSYTKYAYLKAGTKVNGVKLTEDAESLEVTNLNEYVTIE